MGAEGATRLRLDVVVLGGAKVAVPEQRGGQEDVRRIDVAEQGRGAVPEEMWVDGHGQGESSYPDPR